ncbi:unnamed protein product [Peronospora destructor]|uniref:Uncharacterized protein n=1 Tax=Peronospora destructor TaxID=86335 RepID=A0AAV0URL3_9STRA|nr:unnamed protein product [Peronospora destructor]
MKLFTAFLIAATIATQNAVIAQTTPTAPTEMTMTPTAEDGTMMNNSMPMGSSSGDMSGDMSDGDSDMLAGSAANTTSETPVGSGSTMNAGDDAATSTSGAVSIQSVTFTMSAVVAGLATAFVF